jgi:hypothetical protein
MNRLRWMSQPRTTIRLDTMALAESLEIRLDQIRGTGERGITFGGGEACEVTLSEYPRRPEQAEEILNAVAAWLDEVDHPEVTVEFRWHLKRSPKGQSRAAQPVLYWKLEEGHTDAGFTGHRHPHDLGPAWLETEDARGNVTHEPINEGEWIRRADAFDLARVNGYTLSVDD